MTAARDMLTASPTIAGAAASDRRRRQADERPGERSDGRPGGRGGLRLALAGAGALVALAGCANPEGFTPGCPNVGILRDAGTIRLGDESGTLTAVAVMTALGAACDYSANGVSVSARLTITGRPVEGTSPGLVQLEYFVAIADPARNILAKQTFRAAMDLTDGAAETTETLTQFIPAPETVDARYYEVLVGFQLPPEQLEYNRQLNTR